MVMAPSLLETSDIYITEQKRINSDKSLESCNHGDRDLVSAHRASKDRVLDILRKKADSINPATCGPGKENPFYVADMGEIYRQHIRWKTNLGRVKPFYGMVWSPVASFCRGFPGWNDNSC